MTFAARLYMTKHDAETQARRMVVAVAVAGAGRSGGFDDYGDGGGTLYLMAVVLHSP